MKHNEDIQKITSSILSSKKYASIYRPTVRRIVETLYDRYPHKQVEKEARRKLHQIWGAYFTRPHFDKLTEKIASEFASGKTPKEVFEPLLKLQTSTDERIPLLEIFYSRIFEITGTPEKITEYACGVNALTYPWMKVGIQYTGYDVDHDLMKFINTCFLRAGYAKYAKVELGDVISDPGEPADIALLLKVLVLLERQAKNISLPVMEKIPAKFLVVSFPTKTISGKEKGMEEHYRQYFHELIASMPWTTHEIVFENEIVFVVQK